MGSSFHLQTCTVALYVPSERRFGLFFAPVGPRVRRRRQFKRFPFSRPSPRAFFPSSDCSCPSCHHHIKTLSAGRRVGGVGEGVGWERSRGPLCPHLRVLSRSVAWQGSAMRLFMFHPRSLLSTEEADSDSWWPTSDGGLEGRGAWAPSTPPKNPNNPPTPPNHHQGALGWVSFGTATCHLPLVLLYPTPNFMPPPLQPTPLRKTFNKRGEERDKGEWKPFPSEGFSQSSLPTVKSIECLSLWHPGDTHTILGLA